MSEEYDLKSVKLPYLAGASLRLFARLVEGKLGGLITPSLMNSAGVTWLRRQHYDEPPTLQPLYHTGRLEQGPSATPADEWPAGSPAGGPGFHFATVADYAQAYRDGTTTPEAVAERALEAIRVSDEADPPLKAMIAVNREDVLRQARESTQRFQAGRPLGPLDGVPVAVKDEVDMLPYPTTVGTGFLGQAPCREDATVVARMRAAGALLIGKANMHEIGIGVTGNNPHHGTPRNPYGPGHYTGGSSSGPATAVAAGLCPLAIGADGGGSIRIPAAFCGVVGIKPTYGRVSEHGAAPLTWTLAHLGPLAATAADAALGYAILAGPDPRDPNSWHQPAPTLQGWDDSDLSNITVGIYRPWFEHATPEVVAACTAMLGELERLGVAVREVKIPDLEAGRVAHTITITGEMVEALSATYDQHHREHNLDVRVNLALARTFTAADYVKSQRVRTRLIAHFQRALQDVDVILTPATGLTAPPIPAAALAGGESDLTTLIEIMRFATPANMTGLPAISFPAGYSPAGLPIGMQAIGRPWQEPTLLQLALAAERRLERRKPQIWFDLLSAA